MVTDRQSVSVDISVIAGLFMNLVMQKVGKLRLQLALVAFGVALYIKPFLTTCLKKLHLHVGDLLYPKPLQS